MFKRFVWKKNSYFIFGGLFAAITLLGTSCGSESSSTSTTVPDEEISSDSSDKREEIINESSSSVKSSSSISPLSSDTQSNASKSSDSQSNSSSSQSLTNSSASISSSSDESLVKVATYNDLPECTDKNEDEWIHVTSEAKNYFCFRQKWYKTVQIGSQVWMAENLDIDVPNSFYDENTPDYRSKYGKLYTWAAAMDSIGSYSNNSKGCGCGPKCNAKYPVRGICPKGWHLPSKEEFETLIETVGGEDVAGKKLKAAEGWSTVSDIDNVENGWGYLGTNANGTDDFGFTALPAGGWDDGVYRIGYKARFWTSTEVDIFKEDYGDEGYEQAFYIELTVDYKGEDIGLLNGNRAFIDHYYKDKGYSVRCVKD